MRCYIFDLDGTLCDIEHRLHFIKCPEGMTIGRQQIDQPDNQVFKPDWDSFFAACVGDKPIEAITELVDHLGTQRPILFVSGRSDAVREQTTEWLRLYTVVGRRPPGVNLWMRKHGDHRPDHVVKAEILDEILAAGWQPIMAFDDRKQVVDMWRARGIVCAQVAEGNF